MSFVGIGRMPRLQSASRLNTEGCMRLVEEICKLATQDYIAAKQSLKMTPDDKIAKHNYRVKRAFFESEYFENLTDLDGNSILDSLDRGDVDRPRKYIRKRDDA